MATTTHNRRHVLAAMAALPFAALILPSIGHYQPAIPPEALPDEWANLAVTMESLDPARGRALVLRAAAAGMRREWLYCITLTEVPALLFDECRLSTKAAGGGAGRFHTFYADGREG